MLKKYFILACMLTVASSLVSDAFALMIKPEAPADLKRGDVITVSLVVSAVKGEKIRAWGFDVVTKGLQFIGAEKEGTLVNESDSFGFNAVGPDRVRCGAYIEEIELKDGATLVKLKYRVRKLAGKVSVSVNDLVDDLGSAQAAKKEIGVK